MIDWVSGKVFYPHTSDMLPHEHVASFSRDGEIQWQTKKRIEVSGSYESKFFIRSCSDGQIEDGRFLWLEFSGNPVKFLQGHNIWGSSDLTGLVYESLLLCLGKLGLSLPTYESSLLFNGSFKLSRVDINYMYSMGSLSNVNQWLYAAESMARTRQGKGHFSGTTLYYQKKSTRWTLKFYSKAQEIKATGHQLPNDFHGKSFYDYTEDKLRCELTLRTKELKKLGLHLAKNWTEQTPYDVYETYMSKLEMTDQKSLDGIVMDLPTELRSTYLTWKEGYNLKATMSKPTFYRHRKRLIEYGVDISIPSGNRPNNVIPLMRVIEAIPADIPEWAHGTDYYFEPRKAL